MVNKIYHYELSQEADIDLDKILIIQKRNMDLIKL